MHIRMPGPILQAPQGGTSPRTSANLPASNPTNFVSEDRRKEDTQENQTWIKGGKEEDNKRYRKFLTFCEERRANIEDRRR